MADDEKNASRVFADETAQQRSDMVANAALATDKERNMTLMQGIKLYPKAIGWAAVISTCCIMEGFSIALIGNFYAFAPFNRKYGELQPDGTYQVSASWQSGISNGAQVGQILGLLRESSSRLLFFFSFFSLASSMLNSTDHRPSRQLLVSVLNASVTVFLSSPPSSTRPAWSPSSSVPRTSRSSWSPIVFRVSTLVYSCLVRFPQYTQKSYPYSH